MNLLKETKDTLDTYKVKPSDVKWVGYRDGSVAISWDEFEEIARHINYDDGFGSVEINERLVVVGDDWWLERVEYDGSEWWEFKTLPKKSDNPSNILEIKHNERIDSIGVYCMLSGLQ